MGRGRPKRIVALTDEQREELQRWVRRATTPNALAMRARIILACEQGGHDGIIAERAG
jgi:DNA-binding PadR family transcriptional regulator